MKPIPGLNNQYYATEDGKIWSVKSARFLSLNKTSNGYLGCAITLGGKEKRMSVHRLIAIAFLGESKLHVNHKDANKQNNNVSNLEYVTPSQNLKHAFKLGLVSNKGEKHPFSKLTDKQAFEIKEQSRSGVKTSELARKYNVSAAIVSGIKHGYKYSHI